MKKTTLALMLTMTCMTSAGAVERYTTSEMTCQHLTDGLMQHRKGLLRSESKKVPGMMTYSMYSAERQACTGGQAPTNKSVKAKDGPCMLVQCVVPGHAWYRP